MKEKEMQEEEIQKHEDDELFENIILLMEDSKNLKDKQPKQAEKLMQNALKLAQISRLTDIFTKKKSPKSI